MKFNFKENNLDFLRLFFAFQVMVMHAVMWSTPEKQSYFSFLNFLSYLPGVPAFFFVSGFLIYASYEKSPSTLNYFKNRIYRLWPGLIFASLGGLFFVILARYINLDDSGSLKENIIWFISQITIGQAWNPDSFRPLGTGVVNGALWTITVEIFFYISIPIIFWLEKKNKYTIYFLFIASFVIYCFGNYSLKVYSIDGKALYEYLSLTPIVWGWMFLLGSIAYKKINIIEKYFHYLILGLPIMLICILIDLENSFLFNPMGNRLGIIYFIAFASLILFIGFNFYNLNLSFDISYGTYIWHCILINFFLVLNIYSVLGIIVSSLLVGLFSWFYIEKPILNMKYSSLRK